MRLYIFGNGNLGFADFVGRYANVLDSVADDPAAAFLVCDFRGVDTLAMEFLKCRTPHVTVYHVGERPRYLPDKYRTRVSQWRLSGGHASDDARDRAAIEACTHFLAYDGNSTTKRTSGTARNIERCLALGKTLLV